MAYCLLTGKIYLTSIPSYDEITDISYFLLEKAIANKIGINMNCNLTNRGLYKFPLCDYFKNGYIPYEILDDPLSRECHKIFENIMYADKSFKIAFSERSRLYTVQNFFESVMDYEKISHITLEIEDVHLHPLEFFEWEIKANQFCQTIMDTPNEKHAEMPAIRLNIIK